MQNTLMKRNPKELKSLSHRLNRVSKRLLDVAVATTALVAVSPLLIYTAYKIKKEDGGPIFYKQTRAGLNNQPFEMYKFRSMIVNNQMIGTHSNGESIYEKWQGRVPDNFVFKNMKSVNPNITKTGMWIRKYSIDELPQLINVLKGEMSIVGPRPEITAISRYYDEEQLRRLEVKPGITGLAQVSGRSEINHGEKIKYDLAYVENNSFIGDVKIIMRTFLQVIKGKGSV